MSRKLIGHNVNAEFLGEIKADIGYFYLELYKESSSVPELFFHPIIAWALESQTYCPYPVTLSGVQTENISILRPDGIVSMPISGGYCDSVEEWLTHENALDAIVHGGAKR
ncbi:hypothetical protein [Undibacterium sp. Xuan67W]|uniref:hypothetical protein n=1 Tax=Undibacterium sp. Xuan67W TaxID=3413057 RepID=UPI003BF270C9